MSSQTAEVKVRIRQEGAEATKQALMETRAALLGVSKGQLENAQATRELARDASLLANQERLKTRIWMAQHPTLNNLTRAMSTFGSISRGVLAVTTAFSTAILAFNSTQSGLAQVRAELDQARREQALALEKYGYDSEEYSEATEKVNGLEGKMGDLVAQTSQEKLFGLLNFGALIGFIGSSASQILRDGTLARLAGALTLTGASGWFAAGPLLLIAILIGAVALAFYLAFTEGDQFQQFINQFFPEFSGWVEDAGKVIDDVFTMHIPNAFIFMANSAIGVFNTVNSAFGWLVNQFIDGINSMIKAANKVAGAIGLPTMKLIPSVQVMQAPQLGYLESRNWGAGGPGTYSGGGSSVGSPASSVRGPGGFTGAPVVNNYISGSIYSEMELKKLIDKSLKDNLKGHGWS